MPPNDPADIGRLIADAAFWADESRTHGLMSTASTIDELVEALKQTDELFREWCLEAKAQRDRANEATRRAEQAEAVNQQYRHLIGHWYNTISNADIKGFLDDAWNIQTTTTAPKGDAP